MLRKALEKDRDERYQTAKDLGRRSQASPSPSGTGGIDESGRAGVDRDAEEWRCGREHCRTACRHNCVSRRGCARRSDRALPFGSAMTTH
jgi:hypothetical protein